MLTSTGFESLTSGVAKVLTPENKLWDNNVFWMPSPNPTRMTFRSCGVYFVGAEVQYTAVSGQYRTTWFRKNGTDVYGSHRVPAPVSMTCFGHPFALMYFEVGDYIELIGQSNVAGVTAQINAFWAMAMTPEQVILE